MAIPPNPNPSPPPDAGGAAASEAEPVEKRPEEMDTAAEEVDEKMEEAAAVEPATVFRIRLKQPAASLRHKMRVPELCRNFSAVAWCGKLNAIACASETCARIPSSNANPPFWIPIHIVNPERPTECTVFNVRAGNKGYMVQRLEKEFQKLASEW